VVYSTEVTGEVKLLPLPEEEFRKGAVHELSPLDNFRVRILPVLGQTFRYALYVLLKPDI
jgi:tRNA threonylcarbamoyladenosine dehydratase